MHWVTATMYKNYFEKRRCETARWDRLQGNASSLTGNQRIPGMRNRSRALRCCKPPARPDCTKKETKLPKHMHEHRKHESAMVQKKTSYCVCLRREVNFFLKKQNENTRTKITVLVQKLEFPVWHHAFGLTSPKKESWQHANVFYSNELGDARDMLMFVKQ